MGYMNSLVRCGAEYGLLRHRGSEVLGINGSTQQVPRRPILPPGVPGSENLPISQAGIS